MKNIFLKFEKRNDLDLFFFILFFAIIYSFFINPHSQEAVTFAYIANDKITNDYFSNWIFISKNQEPTLQILLPYFLIKLGFNKILLHFIWQTFTAIISFSSVFYFSKLFTKSNHSSFMIMLFLIFHKFINTNLYGLYYPTHFFYFGQMGMYLTLLSITFFLKNKHGFGFKIFIITLLMHAGWGLFNFLLLFILFAVKKYNIKKILNLSNLIFLLSAIIILTIAINNVKQKNFYQSYFTEKIQKTNSQSIKSQNKYTEGHHLKFDNYTNLNEITFFIIKFVFFDLLLLIFWFIFRKNKLTKEENIIKIFLISTFLIYFFIFFQKEILIIINSVNPFLSEKINRIIVNRFLNINNLIFIIIGMSIFMKFITLKKTQNDLILILLFTLLIIFCFIFKKKEIGDLIPYGQYINYVNLVVWSCCVFGMLKITLKNKILLLTPTFIEKFFMRIKKSHIYYTFIIIFTLLGYKNLNTFHEKKLAILSIDKSAPIIFGGHVYGKFDTLYYGDIPWIIPISSDRRFINLDKQIDLYCLENNSTFLRQQDWYSFINNICFKNKTKFDWQQINKNYGFKYLVVPQKNNLNLEKLHQFEDFNIYKIN